MIHSPLELSLKVLFILPMLPINTCFVHRRHLLFSLIVKLRGINMTILKIRVLVVWKCEICFIDYGLFFVYYERMFL